MFDDFSLDQPATELPRYLDDRGLISGDYASHVIVWDLVTASITTTVSAHTAGIRSIPFSPTVAVSPQAVRTMPRACGSATSDSLAQRLSLHSE